jgi:hypothetical protein
MTSGREPDVPRDLLRAQFGNVTKPHRLAIFFDCHRPRINRTRKPPRNRFAQHGQLERLGTNEPGCVVCGEDDPSYLELHHIPGRKFGDELVIVCRNCHRKLRMMKQWQRECNVPVKSFQSERLTIEWEFLWRDSPQRSINLAPRINDSRRLHTCARGVASSFARAIFPGDGRVQGGNNETERARILR